MAREFTDENPAFLSNLPARPGEIRLAIGAILISVVVFMVLAPFAKVQLAPLPAFIPMYQAALVVNDLITTVLLVGQYRILRSPALLILAGAYLFTGLMAMAHMLSFPGLFAPTGLLGAGPQSTAWLYMFWHGVFPLAVLAYALCKDRRPEVSPSDKTAQRAVFLTGLLVAVAAGALTALATAGQTLLPNIMAGNSYTPIMISVVSSVWLLSLGALVVLWKRPPHSVLDLWLMVVMCAWLCDIGLAAVLNAGRFDLGFYTGRIYGLLAASFVLVVLLLENGALYARLVGVHTRERQRNAELQRMSNELESANHIIIEKNLELQQAGGMKSEFLTNTSHELRNPLNAIISLTEFIKDGHTGALSAQQADYIQMVNANAERLLSMINDILDMSRIEAGKMTLVMEQISLNPFLRSCLQDVAADAETRDILLTFESGPADDLIVLDPRRLKQIVHNLLVNAVKFTLDGGEVKLSWREIKRSDLKLDVPQDRAGRLLPLAPSGFENFLEIRVADNGIGMRGADLPELFQTFKQIDASLTRRYGGNGIGLAMVSRLVTLHGGTTGVVSAPDLGTQLVIWLPWRTVDAVNELAGSKLPETGFSQSKGRVR